MGGYWHETFLIVFAYPIQLCVYGTVLAISSYLVGARRLFVKVVIAFLTYLLLIAGYRTLVTILSLVVAWGLVVYLPSTVSLSLSLSLSL